MACLRNLAISLLRLAGRATSPEGCAGQAMLPPGRSGCSASDHGTRVTCQAFHRARRCHRGLARQAIPQLAVLLEFDIC